MSETIQHGSGYIFGWNLGLESFHPFGKLQLYGSGYLSQIKMDYFSSLNNRKCVSM